MSPLLFVSIGFAPGLFWLWQIYRRQRARPDPKHLVVRTFLLGAVSCIPIAIVEAMIAPPREVGVGGTSTAAAAYVAFIVAGVTEEVGKFLVVRWSVYRSPYFDEPMSGLVFGSAAALGFASLENVTYMLSHGAAVILLRGPLSTLAHVVFSCFWAYPLAWSKWRGGGQSRDSGPVLLGLGSAAALHGLFDFFLMKPEPNPVLTLFVFLIGLVLFVLLYGHANRTSPFRDHVAGTRRPCPKCQTPNAGFARFCTRCGTGLGHAAGHLRCEKCSALVRTDATFCTACGSRLATTSLG